MVEKPTRPVEEEAPRASVEDGERPAQGEVRIVPSQGVKYSEQRRRPDVIANTSANARFQALGPFWECLHVEAFLGPVRMIAVVDSGATVTTVTESVIMQAGLRENIQDAPGLRFNNPDGHVGTRLLVS